LITSIYVDFCKNAFKLLFSVIGIFNGAVWSGHILYKCTMVNK